MIRTGSAQDRAVVALQRTGDPPDRTGGAIERSIHVLPLEPAAAHTAGPLIFQLFAIPQNRVSQPTRKVAPKEHLHPTGMMFVRTCVTLENIVHSISRGRIVTKCWNLVCVCNK